MKNLKTLISSLLILLSIGNIYAQDFAFSDQKEIGIQFGFSNIHIHESRYSANTKHYTLPMFGLKFAKQNDKRKEELTLSFTSHLKSPNGAGVRYKIIHPESRYSYQRNVNGTWIGGVFQHSTLLNFPKSNLDPFTNSPLSYTIASGLGLKVGRDHAFSNSANGQWMINGDAELGLLSYVIRPEYGHPYPSDFLTEENFNPTRAGLGKSILKSGELLTINKYQNFKISLGVSFITNSNIKIGLNYAYDAQLTGGNQKSSIVSHDLLMSLSYLY